MSGADRKPSGSPAERRRPLTGPSAESSRSGEPTRGVDADPYAAAERAAERLGVLSEASRMFAEAGPDEQEGLDALATLVAERVRDFCVVALISGDGDFLRFAAFHHRDPEARALLAPLIESVPVRREHGLFGVIESGKALFVPVVAPETAGATTVPGFEAYLSRYGIHSLIVVPLRIQERVIGGVGLSRSRPGDPYTEDDLELVLDLASRAALAIRNAQLFARLERDAKDREEVMAIVAHDLRSPLGVISTAAELLTSLANNAAQGERLRTVAARIHRAAQRMDDLITNVLDATRIESGRIRVKPAPVDVGSLLDHAMETMIPAAQQKGVDLRCTELLESLQCSCDEGRILQVFSNLIGNGIRFTPKGGYVEVRAMADGTEVRFVVEDTGPGIAADILPRVFDRYFKGADAPRTGTGLGLYIARGIVEAHGGRIWVESTSGGGSFAFTLPRA